jgi:hypothetical protein
MGVFSAMAQQKPDPQIAAELREVCQQFRIPGAIYDYRVMTAGNINTTYLVVCESIQHGMSVRIPYTAQKINRYVFQDPVSMMRNIDLVTQHIMEKNRKAGRCERRTRLHFHHTANRDNYYVTESGHFWRLSNYVEDSVAFNQTSDPKVLEMVGKAFGQFQAQLCDFDASQITETIPDFHNTAKRLETFFAHVEEDPCGRCQEVQEEIAFLREQRAGTSQLSQQYLSGELPMRVTHNDTKANNVMLDKDTLEPLVVIDLDTVMPGLAAYDFGDGVRFAANTAGESEKDLSKVSLDLGLYTAFAQGFISATAGFMTQAELDSMARGAVTITIELASRFLDDYITGDKYFKTNFPGENLVRARCQIALAKDMISKYPQMEEIVRRIAKETRQGNDHA